MHQFILSACGGAMIGAAASGLLLLDGKIAGISDILGGALAVATHNDVRPDAQ